MKYVRWLMLMVSGLSTLAGCGARSMTPATVPYRSTLVYPATLTSSDAEVSMTYTFQFLQEHRPDIPIQVQTNGMVTTTLPLSRTVGPIDPGVEYTLPLTFTFTAKGEGTILVLYEPSPGIYIPQQVFVLATDEGVFLYDQSRTSLYSFYLNELHHRGILNEITYQQRRDDLSVRRTLTVPLNGTPTTLNYRLPPLFTHPLLQRASQ